MYWVSVEGRTMPHLVGGHPALDMCNTYAGWGGPPLPKGEWLPDPDALLVWCLHAGLVDGDLTRELRAEAESRPAKAHAVLRRVRQLRSDLYWTLVRDDQESFDGVAGVAQRAASEARLVDRGGDAEWVIPADVGLDLPLLRLGAAAAELLVSENRAQVRPCPGDECGWLFLDRRGTRRWCSMLTCGNRAKAQAFASRRAADRTGLDRAARRRR